MNAIEIVVCDNFSQDHTGEVLRGLTEPRVKCVDTGKRISMRENFNHALAASSGDYVIFFGDDDGIGPGQFGFLRQLLERQRPAAMSLTRAITSSAMLDPSIISMREAIGFTRFAPWLLRLCRLLRWSPMFALLPLRAQRRAEAEHARTRREQTALDRKLERSLTFTGPTE